jgi:hypothetical protein
MAGELLIGGVDDVVALGPVADGGQVDIERDGGESRPWPKATASLMFG